MQKLLLLISFCFCLFYCKAQTITVSNTSNPSSACAGTASVSPNIEQITVNASSLTGPITVTPPVYFEMSLSPTGPFSDSFTLTPSGGSVNTIIYVRTKASDGAGYPSGIVTFTSPGALQQIVFVKAIVNYTPTMWVVSDQTVTAGTLTSAINFVGGSLYSWTNDTPSIGLPASGTGNIAPFTAVNAGSTQVTATIIVTPVAAGFIYTANAGDNSVSVIDEGTNIVAATIPVGQGPAKTIVSPNSKYVYVNNVTGNSISVINSFTNAIITTITLGGSPNDMILTPDGSQLYTVLSGTNNVAVINTATNTLATTIPVGANPLKAAITPDGKFLYVANAASNNVSVINTATNSVIATLNSISAVNQLLPSPDGSRVYIASNSPASVIAINTANNTIISTIPVGSNPVGLSISPDGSKVYAPSQDLGNVSVINTTSNSVIATVPVGAYCVGSAITSDGSTVYAVSRTTQMVYVISTATNTVTATIQLGGTLGSPIISPDEDDVYVPDVGANSVYVINTLLNLIFSNPAVGTTPQLNTGSISIGDGCAGAPESFKIIVNPSAASITATGAPSAMSTTYGTASSPSSTFAVSATGLTSGVTATAPAGFELSTDNSTFSNSVTVGSAGALASTTIYVRLTSTANAGNYSGNIVLSSPGLTSVNVPVPNSTVSPAPLTVTANDVSKPFGTTLTNTSTSISFTATGLENTETIGSVTVTYGTGAAATDPANIYTGSIVPSAATGGSFTATNYTITYLPGNITVIAAPDPIITSTGTLSSLNTTYGSASASESFNLTGTNLSAGLLVTPPAGFEVSADNSTFSNTITIGTGSDISNVPVYIRLSAATNAGNYSGNIAISTGTTTFNEPVPNSTISPATLNIAGTYSKVYGDDLANQAIFYNTPNTPGIVIDIAGLQNGNTFNSVFLTFGDGASATDAAGTYNDAVTPSLLTGNNGFLASNYTVNYTPFNLIVNTTILIIKATDVNKQFGATLNSPTTSANFTAAGLKNAETVGSVSINYGAGAAANDPVNIYTGSVVASAATGGSFTASNYIILYQSANIIVNPVPVPTITYTGTLTSFITTYGTASASESFSLSGENLSDNLIIESPAGFEISTDNVNFGSNISLDSEDGIDDVPIYVRLSPTANVGTYSGNISLNSPGATTVYVPIGNSVVHPASLTITPASISKVYGTTINGGAGSTDFAPVGLKNAETIGSITVAYGQGAASTDAVGNYNTVTASLATGGNFSPSNYIINYAPGYITVTAAALIVTADDKSKIFGTVNPTLTYTYQGFVNDENETQLTQLPVITTTALTMSPVGSYPITVGNASATNYNIQYIQATLIINPVINWNIPNSFTPNGDGINDTWELTVLAPYQNCTVNIFNRYGLLVYTSIGYGTAWDGRYRGAGVPTGTYYYIIDLKNNTKPLSGSLTVIR